MEHQQPLFAVILAAGKGTRMKSDLAKVLHEIFFAPMIVHVMRAVQEVKPEETIVIVGHQRHAVMESLAGFPARFVVQEKQLGTGHAVLCAEETIADQHGVVMVLCGDAPLLNAETLRSMVRHHIECGSTLTLMTTVLENPTNYGRIISDEAGNVMAIVEEKDASEQQRRIKEINAGIYCVNRNYLFDSLKKVGTENSQREVYLTDIVSIAVSAGLHVTQFVNPCPRDILGVNSRVEQALAHKEMQRRRNHQLMLDGVTMHDPDTTAVAQSVSVGRDTVLEAGVRITGNSSIGASCVIGAGALLHNCSLGDGAVIGAYSYLESVTCPAKTVIEPHSIKRNH